MHVLQTALLAMIGLACLLAVIPNRHVKQWRNMRWLYATALLAALSYSVMFFIQDAAPSGFFNGSALSAMMLPLVMFLGLVLSRFSERYMDGQPKVGYFQRWFALTILSVWGVVVSNHMVLFFVAWVAISLCLHRLLMIFPERPRAALAAHKKFIFARLAELTLFAAFTLMYAFWETPWISDWVALSGQLTETPTILSIAALLLAVTAIIKCAQLPIHGWLIQVVESPTPVSALLHAGIVNLGGFLIILFAPLISASSAAVWTLLVWCGLSVLISALVVYTRISVKVRLAWSTSAQMGFMLIECALGYYELAILHMLAHSLYKAHAFLNASSEVDQYLNRKLQGEQKNSVAKLLASLVLALATVALWHMVIPIHTGIAVLYVVMFSMLFNHLLHYRLWYVSLPVSALLFVAVYVAQQLALAPAFADISFSLSKLQIAWVSLLFVLLGTGYWWLKLLPQALVTHRLYRLLYAGFYLDEWATRLTLKAWPTELPKKGLKRKIEFTKRGVVNE